MTPLGHRDFTKLDMFPDQHILFLSKNVVLKLILPITYP